MLDQHGFDFHSLKRTLRLDQYGCIRLINYIRGKVRAAAQYTIGFFQPPRKRKGREK